MLVHRSLTNLASLMVKITFLIVAFSKMILQLKANGRNSNMANGRNSNMANGRNSNMANGRNSNMANRRDSGKTGEIELSSFDLDVPVEHI